MISITGLSLSNCDADLAPLKPTCILTPGRDVRALQIIHRHTSNY